MCCSKTVTVEASKSDAEDRNDAIILSPQNVRQKAT